MAASPSNAGPGKHIYAKCNQVSPNRSHFASIRQVKEQCGPTQGLLAAMSSYVLIMPMIISLLCDLYGRF